MKNSKKFELSEQEILQLDPLLQQQIGDWMGGIELIEDNLNHLRLDLIQNKGKHGLRLSGYGYYPINKSLTKWVATDGSEIEKSLVTMLVDYEVDGSYLTMEPEDMIRDLVLKRRMGQGEFECDIA